MRIPLISDPDGPLLMVALEHGNEVAAALSLAGVRFTEADQEGAGCAGPNLLVLRLEPGPNVQGRVDSALADL